jgi:hypothetical protein
MNMSEMKGMNMIEEQDHLTIHQRGEEDIHMVGSHMVEGMNMLVKHYHPMNHRLEVAGMDMVEEHYHLMNH